MRSQEKQDLGQCRSNVHSPFHHDFLHKPHFRHLGIWETIKKRRQRRISGEAVARGADSVAPAFTIIWKAGGGPYQYRYKGACFSPLYARAARRQPAHAAQPETSLTLANRARRLHLQESPREPETYRRAAAALKQPAIIKLAAHQIQNKSQKCLHILPRRSCIIAGPALGCENPESAFKRSPGPADGTLEYFV